MTDKDRNNELDDTVPLAKLREREGENTGSQPSEFADEMRTNRFTPPPPPEDDSGEK